MTAIPTFQRRLLFYAASFAVWFSILFLMTDGLSDRPWITDWHRWDSNWYLRIWSEGYTSDPKMMVFPPGYSWIVGAVSDLTGSFDLAALLVNVLAFFSGAVMATEFCRNRFDVSPRLFFLFVLSTPLSFYTFSVYSDAVFLLLFWFALVLACEDPAQMTTAQKWQAAAFLFFIPWVRLTGYALIVWVGFRRWFALSVLAALTLWLAVNAYVHGTPFHFLHMQEAFMMPKGGFAEGLREALVTIVSKSPIGVPDSDWHFWFQVALFPVASMILLLITVGWFIWRGENLLAVTMLAVMIFSRNQAFWRSVFRYDWPLMPLLAVPLLTGPTSRQWVRRLTFWILTATCFYIQIVFAIRMHDGYWSF